MPRIHEIIAEVPGYNPPGAGGVPTFHPAASPAEADVGTAETLGKVGSALADQFGKLRSAELAVQGEQLSASAAIEASQAEMDLKNPQPDAAGNIVPVNPDTFVSDYQKRLADIQARYMGQITDPQVGNAFQKKFAEMAKERMIQAYRDQVGMRVDRVKAGSLQIMQELEVAAGTVVSDNAAYDVVGKLRGWLKYMVGQGAYTDTEAERLRQEAESRIFDSRIRSEIDRDVYGFTARAQSGTLPDYWKTFTQKERNAVFEYADRKSREATAEADRKAKLLEDEQKHQDNVQITDLAIRASRGQLKPGELDQARLYNKTLSGDKSTALELENLAQNPTKEGGVTNWNLYNQLWDQAISGKLQVSDVLKYRGTGLGRTEVQKLVDLVQKTEDRTSFDDDYFKQGAEELKNQLLPKSAIIDENRQRRYAAAYGEYVDRVVPLLKSGERQKAIDLARDIANRYATSELSVIPDAFHPRYKTKEETVKAFERGEMSREEYNRQVWIIEQMTPKIPGEGDVLGPPAPKASTKPKRSFSPF